MTIARRTLRRARIVALSSWGGRYLPAEGPMHSPARCRGPSRQRTPLSMTPLPAGLAPIPTLRSACEAVTKLVPSAEADSVLPAFAIPALTRWANEFRPFGAGVSQS